MTEVYGSPYANNIPNMHNSEVVALAKNRFTDAETMLAIAKHWYKLGKEYLAANTNLTPEAARELWNCKGYVLKATMMAHGNIELTEQEYFDQARSCLFLDASQCSNFLCYNEYDRWQDPYHPKILADGRLH